MHVYVVLFVIDDYFDFLLIMLFVFGVFDRLDFIVLIVNALNRCFVIGIIRDMSWCCVV